MTVHTNRPSTMAVHGLENWEVYAIAKNEVSWYMHNDAGYEALKYGAVPTKVIAWCRL